jgi:hypothetical protein
MSFLPSNVAGIGECVSIEVCMHVDSTCIQAHTQSKNDKPCKHHARKYELAKKR